jgi:hypothetical protein
MQTAILTALFLLVIGVLLYLLYRRGALRRLAMLPGESTVCEERDISVDEKRIRHYGYNRCLVRLTDRRLVIAQKVPLAKDAYYIRFVIDYNSANPGIDSGAMVLKGYVPARVTPAQVGVEPDGAGAVVTVRLNHANGRLFSELSFRSERAGEYERVIN